MMSNFLSYTPPGLTSSHIDYCHKPVYRVTTGEGSRFYPIEYHGDLAAWKRQITEGAKYFGTDWGGFERGKFAISDGRVLNFADITVETLLGTTSYPVDW